MLVQVPSEARCLDPPKAEFIGILSKFWELNIGPLQEKYILLTTQASLHSLPTVFDVRKKNQTEDLVNFFRSLNKPCSKSKEI